MDSFSDGAQVVGHSVKLRFQVIQVHLVHAQQRLTPVAVARVSPSLAGGVVFVNLLKKRLKSLCCCLSHLVNNCRGYFLQLVPQLMNAVFVRQIIKLFFPLLCSASMKPVQEHEERAF
jgi:hypothetical protein